MSYVTQGRHSLVLYYCRPMPSLGFCIRPRKIACRSSYTPLPGYINDRAGVGGGGWYQIIDIGAAFYGARSSVLLLQYSFTGLDIELH